MFSIVATTHQISINFEMLGPLFLISLLQRAIGSSQKTKKSCISNPFNDCANKMKITYILGAQTKSAVNARERAQSIVPYQLMIV